MTYSVSPPASDNTSVEVKNGRPLMRGIFHMFAVPTSIQHWQLRNLIHADSELNSFYHVHHNHIYRYDTLNMHQSSVLKDLEFSPTSFDIKNGYLAAVGQRGQMTVRRFQDSWSSNMTTGSCINNSVTIALVDGEMRLMVCNNDGTIHMFDMPSMALIQDVAHSSAINSVSVSPNGMRMLATSDSRDVFLYDLSRSGCYNCITMQAANDASFSCAWDRFSEHFAISSQDGTVSVWDVKNLSKPLIRLDSYQLSISKGACRCVKYTMSGPFELLAFSEHVNYVHLLDARTFHDSQVVRVGPSNIDRHLAGISFSDDNKLLYVATEAEVFSYDIDIDTRRCFGNGSFL